MEAGDLHPAARAVVAWVQAWNALDGERLASLAHPDLRFHRMKGEVEDLGGLLAAVERQRYGVALRVEPRTLYGRDGRYVLAARVEYRHVENGELAGASDDGGMHYELRDGAFVLIAPKLSLAEASPRGW